MINESTFLRCSFLSFCSSHFTASFILEKEMHLQETANQEILSNIIDDSSWRDLSCLAMSFDVSFAVSFDDWFIWRNFPPQTRESATSLTNLLFYQNNLLPKYAHFKLFISSWFPSTTFVMECSGEDDHRFCKRTCIWDWIPHGFYKNIMATVPVYLSLKAMDLKV